MFDRYIHVSRTSDALSRYFLWFAGALASFIGPRAEVLEIGANDGGLIKAMRTHGLRAVGIDPAEDAVNSAQEQGMPVYHGDWPEVSGIVKVSFDAIVCLNVVDRVSNPREFIEACRNKLKPGGMLLIQVPHTRVIGNGEFDACHHENISFFNTRSMSILAESAGFKLFESFIVRISGDSTLFVLGHPESPPPLEKLMPVFAAGEYYVAERLFDYERNIGLYQTEIYRLFRDRALGTLKTAAKVIDEHRALGFEIIFVGATARAVTAANSALVVPDRFLDEVTMKIGLCTPGIGTRVEPLEACIRLQKAALFVITAWEFRDQLVAKLRTFNIPEGSKFYTYLPRPAYL
jgi:SAM-dependent methyltransferase